MDFVALALLFLNPFLFTEQTSVSSDSVTVYQNESYLELEPGDIFIRNMSTAFNPVNDHVYIYDKNPDGLLWEFKPDGSISVLDTLRIPEVHKMMPMEITHSGESLLLWEQGLGKVYEYSFLDSSLQQIDQTRVQDLMVGHGSVIMEDERILVQGGYGFWEFRNFLLEFSRGSGEWSKLDVEGDIPDIPNTYNYLGYLKEENMLIYVYVPLSSVKREPTFDVHTFEPFFEVYTFDLETNRWEYRNNVYPKEKELALAERPRSRSTHSIDDNRGYFIFNGRLTVEIRSFDLFYISHPSVDDLRSTNFYYSENSDRWVIVGQSYNISKPHLVVRSFPAAEAQYTPIIEELPATLVLFGWFLGGLFSLTLMFVGVYFWKNKKQEQERPTLKKFELAKTGDGLTVEIGGENVDLSDSTFKEFCIVVYRMKKQEKSELLMSEFDNMIFSDQHSQPHRSKVKKKIFKLVNAKFDEPFITIDVYPLDKRYKMIVMNLDAVKIHDHKAKTMRNGIGSVT